MNDSIWSVWEKRWEAVLNSVRDIGGEANGVLIKPPARIEQIRKIEQELKVKLPSSFIKVLTEYSGEVELSWSLPDDEDLMKPVPNEFRDIFGSDLNWSLKRLIEVEEGRRGWEQEVFSDPEDEYDSVWHNKLAFIEVGNGDYIAFDLCQSEDYPIVYLSHEDGEGHGYRLGNDFIDFINRWSLIGCVGSEVWQMLPFISNATSGIDPNCTNALKWRTWLKLIID